MSEFFKEAACVFCGYLPLSEDVKGADGFIFSFVPCIVFASSGCFLFTLACVSFYTRCFPQKSSKFWPLAYIHEQGI